MPVEPHSEIAELAALLCDGELAPDQATRLEELVIASAEARRFVLQYLQLHGELLWDQGGGAGTQRRWTLALDEEFRRAVPSDPRHGLSRPARWVAWAVAASGAVVLLGWLVLAGRPVVREGLGGPVARVAAAVWGEPACGMTALPVGSELFEGQQVQLATGLAEVHFANGARVILEGPARFDLVSRGRLFLHEGRLAAQVPVQAAGFTVGVAGALVIDRGTEFGVLVEPQGPFEVHVLAGCVDLQPEGQNAWAKPAAAAARRLHAGQAVRVVHALPGAMPLFQEIALREERFVWAMPGPQTGSVAGLRRMVTSEPSLIHHYPFEGDSVAQRLADHRGRLHLAEVVMAGGEGAGQLRTGCRGWDPTTRAVRPFRGLARGNSEGVGLQSENLFLPPAEMTVELLLRLDEEAPLDGESVCAAATLQGENGCAFLLAAVGRGRLALRLEDRSDWAFGRPDSATMPGHADFRLIPGDWYYVAATFQTENSHTLASAYAANLSRGERTLHTVLRNQPLAGIVSAGRLGIGKGAGEHSMHAFPWPGELDEVAIYGRILDLATLQRHLAAVLGQGTEP